MAMIGSGAKLKSDEGWFYVDPAKVDTQLLGRTTSGGLTYRDPDFMLWIRNLKPRPSAEQDTVKRAAGLHRVRHLVC